MWTWEFALAGLRRWASAMRVGDGMSSVCVPVDGEGQCRVLARLRVVGGGCSCSTMLDAANFWIGSEVRKSRVEQSCPLAIRQSLGRRLLNKTLTRGASSTTQIEERAAVGCTRGELR